MTDYVDFAGGARRSLIVGLAADVIERAAAMGDRRWGATPFDGGLRINVGWTEILTAYADEISLVVHGPTAKGRIPSIARVQRGRDKRGFYPSVPQSIRLTLRIHAPRALHRAIDALRPSLDEAIRLAGRRRAGRGVKAGHRNGVVLDLRKATGRPIPFPGYPEHIPSGKEQLEMMEGALKRVIGSTFERNARARATCIAHHGAQCHVCRFSFENAYGELGRDFIHVHHVVPLSRIHTSYKVNPIKDLIPVCPNCHAMLHREDPPLTVADLRSRLVRDLKPNER